MSGVCVMCGKLHFGPTRRCSHDTSKTKVVDPRIVPVALFLCEENGDDWEGGRAHWVTMTIKALTIADKNQFIRHSRTPPKQPAPAQHKTR
jgi:hypothetical protein